MLYFYFALGLCIGGLLIFLIFRKKILAEPVLAFEPENEELKISNDIHGLVASNIDLSLYINAVDAAESERQRIGTDIHDELASALGSVIFDLKLLSDEIANLSPEGQKLLTKMEPKMQTILISLRNIIYDTIPIGLINRNLPQAINDLCQKNSETNGTNIVFENIGQQFKLTTKQEAYLYRIAQELLNNCIKHSLALQVLITLAWTENELTLLVKDNGIGLPKFIKNLGRFGITGIFIRTKAIGATAEFKSPKKGTEFILRFSAKNQSNA